MSIGEIFQTAQRSNVGHKTLAKKLRNRQDRENVPDQQIKQCIFRLLEVSKSEVAGNRTVKFLTTYMQDADASSPTTSSVLYALLPFLCAKDKTVRYRATQVVSQVLAALNAIDDDLYRVIRHELIKRLHDKVPAIRLEAVMALGRLVENELDEEPEEQDSEEEIAPGLLEKLLDVLQNDVNADVRRALLLNLPITPTTLPYLLERARDRDAPTRRALYSRLLPKLGDFRHLSLSMREKLLRWGLRDRDEKVRQAAARIFSERWIEDCASTKSQVEEDEVDKTRIHEASIPALLELLERIDIMNSGAENGVGLDAMKEFWKARPDYIDAISFEDDFWDSLTTESAFMARTFIDYCQYNPSEQQKFEEKMPEVTRLGFYIQKYLNTLLEAIRATNEESGTDEEQAEHEFILEQLLYISQKLDYTDEIGRRKMFSLLRDAVSVAELPEETTRLAVEALRLVCSSDAAGEREFTSVVLEAIAEVHDTILPPPAESDLPANEEDSFVSARSDISSQSSTPKKSQSKGPQLTPEEEEEKAIKEILVNMKCLHVAQCMLQNITGDCQSNINLENMLNNLVIPAIRSQEAPVRERGIHCLGLCCMTTPKLADENLPLFVHCLKRGDEGMQVMCVQILCDILLSRRPEEVDISPLHKALSMNEEVQRVATESLCKLMLCGFYRGNKEVFDEAVESATARAAKGWELCGKVRAAAQVENKKEEEVQREQLGGMEVERMSVAP